MTLLVVGLGNPGAEYAATRHKAGVFVIDELASARGKLLPQKFHGSSPTRLASGPVALLKPLTYMNESGRSVRAALEFYKRAPSELLVIHDELDLPFGQLRLKIGGGDAGHRGLRSITAHLGGPDYLRLRFGIGRPPAGFRGTPADFVLQGFASAEKAELAALVSSAADAAELVASRGIAEAMSITHRPKA